MIYCPLFVEVKIVDITKAFSGWKLPQEHLVAAASKFMALENEISPEDLKLFAKSLYGGGPAAEVRVKHFSLLVTSMKQKGYSCPYCGSITVVVPDILFPRFVFGHDGKPGINDGRHRVAVLCSMGVKVFPVIIVKVVEGGRKDVLPAYKKLRADVVSALSIFKVSSEWKAYKNTDDFLLWHTEHLVCV